MAFGIDDFLMTMAAGVNLSDTLVRTIRNNSNGGNDARVADLIAEVRQAAIQDIQKARAALEDFTDLLSRTDGADLGQSLQETIANTSFWNPVQKFKLKRAQRSIDKFKSDLYQSCDDVAALVSCVGQTQPMGRAVVESNQAQRDFREAIRNATSVQQVIDLLHDELNRQEYTLTDL